uniref:Uncharacterized protein n=1 Tax=Anopheles funestus TaxID=62324 RepID=A0A182RGM3_ANOFN
IATKRIRENGALFKRRNKINKQFVKEWEADHPAPSASILAVDDISQNFPEADLRTPWLAPGEIVNPDGSVDEDYITSDEELSTSDGEESTNEEEIGSTLFEDDLRNWVLKSNMTHTAMNSLLKLLKTKKVVQSRLPKDYCTLLRTPHRTGASFITIEGVVSFNGSLGCFKCTDIAVHDRATKRMYFTGVGIEKRTDAKFRAREYPQHCKKPTPLTDILYFDIIADVIIADRLHLIDFGVMRKLLNGWIKGKFTKGPHHTKWTSRCDIISEFLLQIKLPSEIHRILRSLQYIKFWKGTEFRTFLHYASVVVLKEILPEAAYKHFLLLFCATTFLSSTVYENEWELAKEMLELFVKDFGTIYGPSSVSSNVHNLQHVHDEVARFGPLEDISTYGFWGDEETVKRMD